MNTITSKSKTICIITCNVNSLVNKSRRIQFQLFLNKHSPDICLISETKLNSKHKLNFDKYVMIRSDRNENTGGGTAILINQKYKYDTINIPLNINPTEITMIKVHLTNNKFLYCGAIYHPPPSPNRPNVLNIDNLNKFLFTQNMVGTDSYFVIGGDLNAKHQNWFNNDNNQNGRLLNKWLTQNRRAIKIAYSRDPTYPRCASYLDFFLIHPKLHIKFRDNHNNSYLKTLDLPFSDHNAVELIINTNLDSPTEINIKYSKPIEIYNYKSASWEKFRKTVKNSIDCSSTLGQTNLDQKNLNSTEIDECIASLSSIIVKGMNSSIKKINLFSMTQIDLPQYVLNLLKRKHSTQRQLHREFLNTGNRLSQRYAEIKSEIRCLSNMIDNSLSHCINKSWNMKLNNIKHDCHMFKNINSILGIKNHPTIPNFVIPFNQIQNTHSSNNEPILVSNNKDKANALGTQFAKVHKQNNNMGDIKFTHNIEDSVYQWLTAISTTTNHTFLEPVTQFSNENKSRRIRPIHNILTNIKEITKLAKDLNCKKSCGIDEIPNIVIKKLPAKAFETLCIIYNNCLNISYFPQSWKFAKILPIPKPNKTPSNIVNFRPISLLPCLGKLFERIILKRLIKEMNTHPVIPDCQFGFRPQHSTVHAIITLKEDIVRSLIRNEKTVACSIDIEKAFDTVWSNGLIWKMKYKYEFSDGLCLIVRNFLKNRYFNVEINTTTSNTFPIAEGVPQGAILSPVLFNIFMSDIPQNFRENTKLIQYADDTIIYNTDQNIQVSNSRLNTDLKIVNEYFNRWKIKINVEKCEAIIFRNSSPTCGKNIRQIERGVKVVIDGISVAITKKIKYLGIVLTNLLKNNLQLKHAVKKANAAKSLLYPVLNAQNKLNQTIKLTCYKQLIRPQFLYGFPLWFDISSNQMEIIKRIERKCLRQCLNIVRTPDNFKYVKNEILYQKSNITEIDHYLINNALKIINNLEFIENGLIQNISYLNNDQYFVDALRLQKRIPPTSLVYLNKVGKLYNHENELIYYKT